MIETIQPNYNHIQINYVHDLRQQAIAAGDVDKNIGVSAFMIGYYFKLGYDNHFRKYWRGEAHKLSWQTIGERKLERIVLTAEGTIGEFPSVPETRPGLKW